MQGVVLIDEIDLYLHPSWQATFVSALRRVFPKIQFIATTHSPVILAGLAPHEVVRLQADPETGDVVRQPGSEHGPTRGRERPRVATARPTTDDRQRDLQHLVWRGTSHSESDGGILRRYLVLAEDRFRTDEEQKAAAACGIN